MLTVDAQQGRDACCVQQEPEHATVANVLCADYCTISIIEKVRIAARLSEVVRVVGAPLVGALVGQRTWVHTRHPRGCPYLDGPILLCYVTLWRFGHTSMNMPSFGRR